MLKQICVFVAGLNLFFTSCKNTTTTGNTNNKNIAAVETQNKTQTINIAFTEAKNYFVNNSAKKLDNPKIETAEKFHEIFGMATTMGKDGKPTEIDFTQQYVIAVIFPETVFKTSIEILNLQKNANNEITLTYKSTTGEKGSYTTIPNKIIIVDKKENGSIKLKEVK